MCCKNFWTKILPFTLAFLLAVFAVNVWKTVNDRRFIMREFPSERPVSNYINAKEGTGRSGAYFGEDSPKNKFNEIKKSSTSDPNRLQVISKPRAEYTDVARQNNVQGIVTLRVTFLANGQIGNISVVSGLPYGLTEHAVSAAKRIRFTPQRKDGRPISVTKSVQYNFTIY